MRIEYDQYFIDPIQQIEKYDSVLDGWKLG